MSFLIHRSGRGRTNTVRLAGRSFDPAICARLPRNAQEFSALVGLSDPPNWFWSESDKGSGYFYVTPPHTKYITKSGLLSHGFHVNLIDSHNATFPTFAKTAYMLSDGVSFAFVHLLKIEHYANVDSNASVINNLGSGTMFQCYPYRQLSKYVVYAVTPEGGVVTAISDAYSYSGLLHCLIYGWDARTRKFWTHLNGSVVLSADSVSSRWSECGALYIDKRGSSFSLVQLAMFVGSNAETIKDSVIAIRATLTSMLSGNGKITSSCSSIYHRTSSTDYDVSFANRPYSDETGILIHTAVQNLMLNSRGMKDWTPSDVTITDWQGIAADGMRGLTAIEETAVDAEHTATINITPLATGRHWFEFTCRMSTAVGVSVELTNGTDASYVSFDVAGNDTDYVVRTTGTVFSTIGTNLYRVKVPIDITVLDALTITARCIYLSGVNWLDSYLGVTSRVAYIGDWSFVKSDGEPLVIPISTGSAATAIVPIVDWTDPIALERLGNGRLTARLRLALFDWPETDIPVLVWRKDATNGVELWLKYQGTLDNRRQYKLSVVSIASGASTETVLTGEPWVLQSDYRSTRVESMSISISIDSGNVAKWWVRSESGDDIEMYENAIVTTGENIITDYVATMIPVAIRLGSDIGGTGQQNMTISEVSVW